MARYYESEGANECGSGERAKNRITGWLASWSKNFALSPDGRWWTSRVESSLLLARSKVSVRVTSGSPLLTPADSPIKISFVLEAVKTSFYRRRYGHSRSIERNSMLEETDGVCESWNKFTINKRALNLFSVFPRFTSLWKFRISNFDSENIKYRSKIAASRSVRRNAEFSLIRFESPECPEFITRKI